MGIFRRSNAEDAVDRYNHTWCVGLLLVLSLITWLLLLSPYVTPPTPVVSTEQQIQVQGVPRYAAQCWCPVKFSSFMIMYVQSACGAAFNQAIEGNEDNNTSAAAVLYDIEMDQPVPVGRPKAGMFKPDVTMRDLLKQSKERSNTHNSKEKEGDTSKDDSGSFISVVTPLALFLFAICLKLPHVIWTLFSGLTTINIDQTLETAKSGQKLDRDSRYRLKEDLTTAVANSARSSSSSTTLLYIVFKVLMCVAAICGLLMVNNSFLPEVGSLQSYNEAGKHEMVDQNMDSPLVLPDYSNQILYCHTEIRQMQNIQQYLFQCVFTPLNFSNSEGVANQMSQSQKTSAPRLGLYKALYTILLVFFAVLVIININNLLTWLIKLMLASCRQRFNASNNLPLDIYLLLYMAQENAGPLVTRDLAEGFASINKKEKQGDEQELNPTIN